MNERLPINSTPEGVSVSLKERQKALGELAAMYAAYAKADGGVRALDTLHRRDIQKRIPNAPEVMYKAKAKAAYSQAHEAELMEPLMKSEELIGAGFDPRDVEDEALKMKIKLRHTIGVNVGHKARNDSLKKVS